jgi:hypothetical protein
MSLTEFAKQQIEAGAESTPDSDTILPVLEQFAAAALEGGVRHTWQDWLNFTPTERRAWINAGRIVAAQEARRAALAARGEAGYQLAGADTEGTGEHDRAVCVQAANNLAARL